MDTDDEQSQSILVESFLFSGRVTNIISLLAFHPQYLDCFIRTQYFMMRGEGPLPFNWRNYLAILVSISHALQTTSFSSLFFRGCFFMFLND